MPAESSYADEQRALAEGQTHVSVPIPKAPEVNPDAYRDVLGLVFKGFLTLPSTFGETRIVWKSLNQHEFDLIRLSTGHGEEGSAVFWDTFITYSAFMVDGINLLTNREQVMPRVMELVRQLPRDGKQKVVRYLSELNRKSAMATLLTEAYAMESYSRFRWAQVRGLDLTQTAVTGIPGTERLGLNWAQLTWRALNHFEDTNAENERAWENAKFIGACMAGKGVQKVYNQDHDRHRKEAEDRIARRDLLLRHVYEGTPLDEASTVRGNQVIIAARTVEDLAKQMERDLNGEKDWHDEVVAAHEARLRERVKSHNDALKELAKTNETRFQGKGIQGGTSHEGLTLDQVRERQALSRQEHAQALARMQSRPQLDQRMTDHMERWGHLPEDEQPSPPLPLVPPRDAGKPFRRT